MKAFPRLETDRLILRAFSLNDAADVKKLAGEKEIAANTLLIPHPYEDGIAEEWISTHPEQFESEKAINFAITLKSNGTLIGSIGLADINREHQKASLGYWIGKPYRKQGYCTEAGKAVISYAFQTFGLNRISAQHYSRNPASGCVMRKIGMKHEGMLRQNVKKWSKFEDSVLYGIIRDDYEE